MPTVTQYKKNKNWSKLISQLIEVITTDVKSIAIKSNLIGPDNYPFTTSERIITELINLIRESFKGEILIVESEFSDCNWNSVFQTRSKLVKLFKEKSVKLVRANMEVKVEFTDGLSAPLYLPKSWVDADLRINLSNLVLHSHHTVKTIHAAIFNLIPIMQRKETDFSFFTKKDYVAAAEFELQTLVDDIVALSSQVGQFNIIDGLEIGYSNEHSPYVRSEEFGQILFGASCVEVEKMAIELTEIKNSYKI